VCYSWSVRHDLSQKEMIPQPDPVVMTFVASAKEFCRVLEYDIVPLDRHLVQRLLQTILDLYSAGSKLPEVDPERDEHQERFFSGETRQEVLRAGTDKLGRERDYNMISEPLDPGESNPVTASLADDLSDIYFEIKEGLM